MEARTILLCIADHQWTLGALHLACSLALDTGNTIALISLVAVAHPLHLGTSYAYWAYGVRERELAREYIATLQDYDVSYVYQIWQFVTFADAVVNAAEQLDSEVVFATPPGAHFPLWRRFQIWGMRRSLAKRQCALYTLDNPLETLVWSPGRMRHSEDKFEHER